MPPPKKSSTTAEVDFLKPYRFHRLDLVEKSGSDEALAQCPFCGREGKFSVKISNGLWRCLLCNEGSAKGGGNITTFVRCLWTDSDKATSEYGDLASSRNLLYPETLIHWQVARSVIDDKWLVPGFKPDGQLKQLYRYTKNPEGRMILCATPTLGHGIHGLNVFDPKKPNIYVCEGPWDAIALWEVLRITKVDEDGNFVLTASEASSLAVHSNVIAMPGCNVFEENWAPLFAGKRVMMMYDNDHPRVLKGKTIEGGAMTGMRKMSQMLAVAEAQPEELHYLRWAQAPELDHDPELPKGYDVRDWLSANDDYGTGSTPGGRVKRLKVLLDKIKPIPSEWVAGRTPATASTGSVEIECLPCTDWKFLVQAWRKAMKWTEGLDRALSICLASIASTEVPGDQLWMKIIGPASCGKSTICEALSVAKKYVLAKSTMRGFHSGFQANAGSKDDASLLALVNNKSLVTKDGDTLLQSPNLSQILSEARDVYDRVSRTHYRTGMSRDYEGVNMTWLLFGTSSLRSIDSSELGERFLDCVIMEGIDDDLEDEIGVRVANRNVRVINMGRNGSKSTDDSDMLAVKQLTGGYVNYLRENADQLLQKVTVDESAIIYITKLAKFVAYMRARPSSTQNETAEREFSARLISQHIRLAMCLAVVLGRDSVDEEVMRRTRQVALDTARGVTLTLVSHLHTAGATGVDPKTLGILINEPDEAVKKLLRFLRKIGVVEPFVKSIASGLRGKPRWRVIPRLRKLYEEVTGVTDIVIEDDDGAPDPVGHSSED